MSYEPTAIACFIYTAMVLASSLVPMSGSIGRFSVEMGLTPSVQNIFHIPMFAVLTILWLQFFKAKALRSLYKHILVIAAASLFGIVNELIQTFIPGRYAGVTDLSLNLVGIVLGTLIFIIAGKLRQTQSGVEGLESGVKARRLAL
jgi:glycopeptide antibiotics resistance protein